MRLLHLWLEIVSVCFNSFKETVNNNNNVNDVNNVNIIINVNIVININIANDVSIANNVNNDVVQTYGKSVLKVLLFDIYPFVKLWSPGPAAGFLGSVNRVFCAQTNACSN